MLDRFKIFYLLFLSSHICCASVALSQVTYEASEALNISMKVKSEAAGKGDIVFYDYVIQNQGLENLPWRTIHNAISTLPRVVAEDGELLIRGVHFSIESTVRMIPEPANGIKAGDSYSFVTLFLVPIETAHANELCFTIPGDSSETKFKLSLRQPITDLQTHKQIFFAGIDDGPIVSFDDIRLSRYLSDTVAPFIPRLQKGSNLRQLFQFMVDGWPILKSSTDAKQIEARLRLRSRALNPGLRTYLDQMMGKIARVSLEQRLLIENARR